MNHLLNKEEEFSPKCLFVIQTKIFENTFITLNLLLHLLKTNLRPTFKSWFDYKLRPVKIRQVEK